MEGTATLLPPAKAFCADQLLSPNAVHLFTDGSCNRKDKTGGWGAVLVFRDTCVALAGNQPDTTNNEMELGAILYGLNRIKPTRRPILVYSDSEYSVNCVSRWWRRWQRNGWMTTQGNPVKNREMIEQIVSHPHYNQAAFQWVRGHAGHLFNEWADGLAGNARRLLYKDIQL